MGYKTEINYILKASTIEESKEMYHAKSSDKIKVTKSGHRTYVMGAPIMFANSYWEILGMCIIEESVVSEDKTTLTAKVLTEFTDEEIMLVSRVIQEAEKLKG